MEETLRHRIIFLEEKVRTLRDLLTDPSRVSAELQLVQMDLRIAELALASYRAALERELSSPSVHPSLEGDGSQTP